MRRMLLLALAVATAAAVIRRIPDDEYDEEYTPTDSEHYVNEKIFRPGYEYIYRYESQVLTGIRTVSDQSTAFKIHSLVKFQFTRSDEVVMKMNNIQIFQHNGLIPSINEYDIVPNHELTKLTGEQDQIMIDYLSKPIKFRYEEGEVSEVKTVRSDRLWSINIKKGLISVLQLKLNGKSTSFTESDDVSSYTPVRSSKLKLVSAYSSSVIGRRSSSRLDGAFKIMETDVNGECETKYVINTENPIDRSSVSEMKVITTKNFDNCLVKHSYEQGLFANLPHLQSERLLIQPAYVGEYDVTGDRSHFLIKNALVRAKFTFRPYGQEGGEISTHMTQRLRLETTKSISNPIPVETVITERNGLKMEIPRASWLPENAVRGNVVEEHEWKEVIDGKLNELISTIYPVMHETSAAELMQLHMVVRHVPRRQLFNIVKSYVHSSTEVHNKKLEIMLDILPTCVNPECAKVLIDLIRDGTIHGLRARLSINAMVLTVKPTPEVVKTLMSLYRESETLVRTTPFIRQTILLGVGTITNKMLNVMRRVNKPIHELNDAVEEISQELISLLRSSNNEKDKIRVIKALGNMGSKEILNPLKSIIEDKSEPLFVRMAAICSLRKLAGHFDKLAHPILLSVIMNKEENPRLRIVAVLVLKNSLPSYTTLEMLAYSLHNEPSTQVKTYIYTTLINLANTKMHLPELIQRSKDARKVLKLIRAIPVGILDSKSIMFNVFSETLDLGKVWKIEKLKSDKSPMPFLLTGHHARIFGHHIDLAKFGFDTKLVAPLARRLFGPYGMLKDLIKNKASIYDLFKPLQKSEMTSEWREMFGKTAFEPRMEEEMKSYIFGELLGYEMFYHDVDQELMEKIIKFAGVNVGEWIMKLKEGVTLNHLKTVTLACNSLVVPTPMGLPLSLNVSAAGIIKIEGHVKATSLPSVSDFIYSRPFVSKPIALEGRIKPSWNVEVFGYMGVDMRWLRMGTALKANLMGKVPVKGEVLLNPVDSKLTVKIEPPTENVKLFSAKVEPVTFIYHVPKTINRLPFTAVELKPILSHDGIFDKKFQNQKLCELTGFKWGVKAHWTECGAVWCPIHPLTGKQSIELTFENTDRTPKELTLTIKKFSQDWFREEISTDDENVDDVEFGTTTTHRRPPTNYRTNRRVYGDNVEERGLYDEDMNVEEGFETVERDSYIATPKKVQLWIDLGLSGYRSNKLFKGKVTWMSENNYLEHQLNLQLMAKPCSEMNEFKVMLNGLLRCPFSVESYSHVVSTKDVIGKVDLSWGRTGFQEKSIKLKMWELDNETWKQELLTEGININQKLRSLPFNPKQFRYAAEVTFPKITPTGSKYLTKTTDLVKMLLYRYVTVGVPENIPQNKLVIYGEYMTKADLLNLIVKTPRETNLFIDLPIRSPWSRYYRPSMHDVSPSSFYSKKYNMYSMYSGNYTTPSMYNDEDIEYNEDIDEQEEYERYVEKDHYENFELEDLDKPEFDDVEGYKYRTPSLSGVCEIHRDKLMTFDGTPILLPVHSSETAGSKCDVLFARDCSESGTFSVSGAYRHGRWNVKVFLRNYNIELIPESTTDRVTIKVNDKVVRVRSNDLFEIHETPEDERTEVVGTIEKIGEGFKVKLHELGVTIFMNENSSITIKVSPTSVLQGQLCGLCGDNNYDVSDDMTSLQGKMFSNSRDFVMDSVIPSGHCEKEDYRTKLFDRHEKSCKKMTTMKIERSHEVCFSKSPVPVCKKHCSVETTSSKTVSFVCLPRGDRKTSKFLKKYNSGSTALTHELVSLEGNFEKEIEIDEKCVPERMM